VVAVIYISIVSFCAVFLLIVGVFFYLNRKLAGRPVEERLKALSSSLRTAETDLERNILLSDISFLDNILKRVQITAFLSRFIGQAGLRWTVGRFIFFVLCLAASGYFIAVLIKLPFILSLLIGIIMGGLPVIYISRKRQMRISRFDEQLPDCLNLLASVLRAGLGLTVGMKLVGEEMPNPSGIEFRKTFSEINLGLDLKDAMERLTNRIYTPELSLFVVSVLIQREVGGNLAEFLNKLELIIRERFKLKRELKTLTAQTMFSGWIVALVPIVVGGILFALNPDYMKILFSNPIGQKLLVMAFILQFLGFLLMRRLCQIKI